VLVLIADDDVAIRKLVRAVAEMVGHDVLEVADGEAAWVSVQAHRPDVVVLDLRMPRRDGLAVTRAIKNDPALAGTRVVLLSGTPGDDAAAAAAGADVYLLKPCKVAALQAAITG
jgi:CheY-like chemotaxis protein